MSPKDPNFIPCYLQQLKDQKRAQQRVQARLQENRWAIIGMVMVTLAMLGIGFLYLTGGITGAGN
jgi:hypothetical protein